MSGTTASGWPYVTPGDYPKAFPAHSQALANKLEAGGPFLRAGLSANTAGLAAAATQVPMTLTQAIAGTDLTLASGWVRANVAGRYMVGVTVTMSPIPTTDYQVIASIFRGGAAILNATLAQGKPGVGGSGLTVSGSLPVALAVNDEVRLLMVMGAAGTILASDYTSVWAQRFA